MTEYDGCLRLSKFLIFLEDRYIYIVYNKREWERGFDYDDQRTRANQRLRKGIDEGSVAARAV